MVRVRHRADRGEALTVDEALLTGIQAERHVALVTSDDLRVGAGGAGDRAALADLHLHVVDDRPDRDAGERHGVARLHVDLKPGDHLVADREALRGDDVGLLAVSVLDQCDEARPVGVVFQPLDLAGDVELAALEVDDAVRLLVTAAAETHGDAASVVAAALLGLADGQRLDRLAPVETAAIDDGELAQARRRRLECLESHGRCVP